MQRSFLTALTVLLTVLLAVNVAGAETSTENAIKYRQAVMGSLAAHAETLSLMAFNKVEQNEFYQSHADALANGTAELKFLFPEGSGQGDTHALPEIWENPEDFSATRLKAEEAFAALREAVAGGNNKAIRSAFAAAGKTCKGCHEKYREEHDD
jgi:cytochrome c556